MKKYAKTGSRIKTAGFCLIAPAKSRLKMQINIREIPHPGQCSFVKKLMGQEMAKPVYLFSKKYKTPAVSRTPTAVKNLIIRFFINKAQAIKQAC